MSQPTNAYEALGVKPDSTDEQIKARYRKLAASEHPDVSKRKDAEERMKALNHAWDWLKTPARRTEHDRNFMPKPILAMRPVWIPVNAHGMMSTATTTCGNVIITCGLNFTRAQ